MALEEVVYKISTDPSFAESMQSDPRAALKAAGLELDEKTLASLIEALKRVDIRKLSDDPEGIYWYLSQFQTSTT
jgi:hypothetical protein